MASFFQILSRAVSPFRPKALNTDWLDSLPVGDYVEALDIVKERLAEFSAEEDLRDADALATLLLIDERSRSSVASLTWQYVKAAVLANKIDERMWQAVYGHYSMLATAYRAFLDRCLDNAAQGPFQDSLPQLLLNLIDCERCMAKWRYLRYQEAAEGAWLRMHALYQLAELQECTVVPLSRYPGQPQTTISACYLEALMLNILNHNTLSKIEIEIVAEWLAEWCKMMTLSAEFDELSHLFYVDLEEDVGGRRVRNIRPASTYRYWELDKVEDLLTEVRQELQQGEVPTRLKLLQGVGFQECLRLIELLLADWSRNIYSRQRRSEQRSVVARSVQVVNGIQGVCLLTKRAADEQRMRTYSSKSSNRKIYREPLAMGNADGVDYPSLLWEEWIIENESYYGLGAVVSTGSNSWLMPGKLIAMEGESGRGNITVGVVRSVRQLPANRHYVGVELLCHTPSHVQMKNLETGQQSAVAEKQRQDIFLSSTLASEGVPGFSALYLPRDGRLDIPQTLLMPALMFVAGGLFELRADYKLYQVRLGKLIEQKNDWVRVVIEVVDKQAV